MFRPHRHNRCLCLSSMIWDRFESFWPNIQLKVHSSSCYVTSASLDSPNKACTPLHILSCDELGSTVCQRSRIFTWYQTQSNHPQRSQTSKVSMNCLEPFKPQYPHTNSPNWSPHISLRLLDGVFQGQYLPCLSILCHHL